MLTVEIETKLRENVFEKIFSSYGLIAEYCNELKAFIGEDSYIVTLMYASFLVGYSQPK